MPLKAVMYPATGKRTGTDPEINNRCSYPASRTAGDCHSWPRIVGTFVSVVRYWDLACSSRAWSWALCMPETASACSIGVLIASAASLPTCSALLLTGFGSVFYSFSEQPARNRLPMKTSTRTERGFMVHLRLLDRGLSSPPGRLREECCRMC